MASVWPAKNNYATGDVLTAANMNGIGDDLNNLYDGINNRNPLINGGMDIWARGTSWTSISNAIQYTADRWFGFVGATATQAQAIQSTSVPTGFSYSMKFGRPNGTTGTNQQYLAQILETVNSLPFAGKTITLSFYAKKGANYSAASDLLLIKFSSGTGTDQSSATFSGGPATGFTGNSLIIDSSVTLTTSWQRFSASGTIASTATQLGLAFGYTPTGTAGADDNFYITGVQIDVGSYMLPFRRSGGTIQGELAACQRYYFRTVQGTTGTSFVCTTRAYSTTMCEIFMPLPVPMRVYPTALDYSNLTLNAGATNYTTGTWTLRTYGQTTSPYIEYVHGSAVFTAGSMYNFGIQNGYVGLSAEL